MVQTFSSIIQIDECWAGPGVSGRSSSPSLAITVRRLPEQSGPAVCWERSLSRTLLGASCRAIGKLCMLGSVLLLRTSIVHTWARTFCLTSFGAAFRITHDSDTYMNLLGIGFEAPGWPDQRGARNMSSQLLWQQGSHLREECLATSWSELGGALMVPDCGLAYDRGIR